MTVEGRVRTGVEEAATAGDKEQLPKAKETERAEEVAHRGGGFPVSARVSTKGCLSTCRDGSDRDDIKWPVAMKMYTLRLWSVRKGRCEK